MDTAPTPQPRTNTAVLALVLKVMRPLVRWLLRSGVGHAELSTALKLVFLDMAMQEVKRTGLKQTDSALSLLSGLHRKDVKQLQSPAGPVGAGAQGMAAATPAKASLASQVVARWLGQRLPEQLETSGAQSPFEALVRSVSTDVHPRALQQELLRLGVAEVVGTSLRLRQQGFLPDANAQESRELLADSAADHLSAGVHNLTSGEARKFLEQSVFADGLSEQSARQLELLATELWHEAMKKMINAAVPLCEQDEPRGGDHRLRLGMFCFAEPMTDLPGGRPTSPTDATDRPTPLSPSTRAGAST